MQGFELLYNIINYYIVITSAKDIVFLPQFVGWFVCQWDYLQMLWMNLHENLEVVGFETRNSQLDFEGDLDPWICFHLP